MKLIDEKEIIKQAEEKARCFESFGEIKYDQHDIRMFAIGAEFAEQKLTTLSIEFVEWVASDECKYFLLSREKENILWCDSLISKGITTKQLFDQFIKTKQNEKA